MHTVPIDFVLTEELVEAWLIAMHFSTFEIEILYSLPEDIDFKFPWPVGVEEVALVPDRRQHFPLPKSLLLCIRGTVSWTVYIQYITHGI